MPPPAAAAILAAPPTAGPDAAAAWRGCSPALNAFSRAAFSARAFLSACVPGTHDQSLFSRSRMQACAGRTSICNLTAALAFASSSLSTTIRADKAVAINRSSAHRGWGRGQLTFLGLYGSFLHFLHLEIFFDLAGVLTSFPSQELRCVFVPTSTSAPPDRSAKHLKWRESGPTSFALFALASSSACLARFSTSFFLKSSNFAFRSSSVNGTYYEEVFGTCPHRRGSCDRGGGRQPRKSLSPTLPD